MKFKNGGRYCEREVYFAHSMLYHPDRFFNFAKRLGMKTEELCKGYKGLENDTVFLVQNSTKKLPRYNKLGELFEKSITADSLKYEHKNDYPPETGWNSGDAYFSFSRYMCSREELLKICYGVWDHMKNHGDHGVDNWELEWIGFLPGKRESRRYIGKYIVTENDVTSGGRFDDLIAYAGWSMDDHFPEGFYYREGYPTIFHPAPTPWGLPLRCMISKNIENLCFAGRNISVTHAALSSSRVMATCSILGQALGTAAALAVADKVPLENVDIHKLQQSLMEDDCYLPWHDRELPALTKTATCSCSIVRNGIDRGEENCRIIRHSDVIEYKLDADTRIHQIRLIFDSDLNRDYHNMPCNYPLVQTRFKLPETLIKEYRVEGVAENGDVSSLYIADNHQRFVKHTIDWNVKTIRFIPLATHGCREFRLFDFEIS